MSPTVAAHRMQSKDSNRALAGALFGETPAHAGNEKPAFVDLICSGGAISLSLSTLLAGDRVAIRAHRTYDAFARSDGIHLANCLIIDASTFGRIEDVDFRALCAQVPTIIIAGRADLRAAVRALKMGAVDLLESPLDGWEVSHTVKSAISASRAWRQSRFCRLELRSRFSALTPREEQVLELVAQGRLNKQIAWSLGLSEVTVKVHRGSVMRKMGARSLADLVRMADALVDLPGELAMLPSPSRIAAA